MAELRRRRRYLPSLAALGSTFAWLALSFWLLQSHLGWPIGLLTFVANGFMQYRLVLACHEATHRTLLPPLWLNETVGLLCASLVGVSFFNYRRAHYQHHKFPQRVQDDIDSYIYLPLLRARPGWRRFARLFVGNYLDILTKLRRKFFGDGEVPGSHALANAARPSAGQVLAQITPIAGVQLGLLGLFWWQINVWAYLVWWLAPVFVIALQLDRIRTFLEHGYSYLFSQPQCTEPERALQGTIDVETSFLERYLFAPFGFSDHQAHHAQLTVPFYSLPELRRLLEKYQRGYVRRIRASYLTILVRMIRAPSAPAASGPLPYGASLPATSS